MTTRGGRGARAVQLHAVPRSPAVPAGGPFVGVEALGAALEAVDWAPLRLASDRRERPTSPRLPHALVLHLAHDARTAAPDAASVADVAIRPDLGLLEAWLGTDVTVVRRTLEALTEAELLAPAGDAVRLSPALCGAAPRCAGLDWRSIAAATVGSPSAWVAAHALAERLDPYDWTPVARGGLERALGAGVSGVRASLERLVAAEVVERREQRGGVSVYRFTDRAWGRGGAGEPWLSAVPGVVAPSATRAAAAGPAVGAPAAFAPRPSAPPPAPAAAPPPPRPYAAGDGMRLVLGGVELDLPAGCRVQVVLGPDGRPTVMLAGPADGR